MTWPSLIALERWRNEGTRTYSPHAAFTEAEPRYQPQNPSPHFLCPCLAIPQEQLRVYRAQPNPALEQRFLHRGLGWFPIHPQLFSQTEMDPTVQSAIQMAEGRRDLMVQPMASTRTLWVEDGSLDHAIKVHFPFRISRYHRKMREEVIVQALAVSQELQNREDDFPKDFGFLREVLGLVLPQAPQQTERGEHWGSLIREMEPYPQVESSQRRWLLPGFSLYGRDPFQPEAALLLDRMTQGKDVFEVLMDQIILPIIRHWIFAFRRMGFLLEPHGQNVLFEMDEQGTILRVIHRDLSIGIDMRRRQALGLSLTSFNGYNLMNHGWFNSITYDCFMGHHFFEPLVAHALARDPRLQKSDFYRVAQQVFAAELPDFDAYFPRTVWYFSEERDCYGKPGFQDTGEAPLWRPKP
jgi:siderophore synthetase component